MSDGQWTGAHWLRAWFGATQRSQLQGVALGKPQSTSQEERNTIPHRLLVIRVNGKGYSTGLMRKVTSTGRIPNLSLGAGGVLSGSQPHHRMSVGYQAR